jgi:catechol 2,3-dioxygenase-like lactoylglutathione lyase family enzyme
MQKYHNNVQDQFGNVISGVTVTIRENPGGGLASIFSDNTGTVQANPFTNDSDGEFFFYAENGRYDVELTGPVTDTKTDILLLDVLVTANTTRIITDTDAPAGPTGQVGTGTYDIFDLDESDRLAQLGFIGGSNGDLRLRNDVHAGHVQLSGAQTAGTEVFLATFDPDGGSLFYHAGLPRLGTAAGGIVVVRSDGSTDAEARYIALTHQDQTNRGRIGHTSANDDLNFYNQIHGGRVLLTAEDAGGLLRRSFQGDPDGATTIYGDTNVVIRVAMTAEATGEVAIDCNANSSTDLYFNGIVATRTTVAGFRVSDTSGNDPLLEFSDDVNARVGYLSFSNVGLDIVSEHHGADVSIIAEDVGGTPRTILLGDPDGITTLSGDTDVRIRVNADAEVAIYCTANGSVGLYHNGIIEFQTTAHATGSANTGAQVKHRDGNFYDVGLAKLPLNTISANEDLDELNQQFYTRKTSGGAVTLELQNDSNIQTGTTWQINNKDTEDLTIDATTNTCTLNWMDGGGVTAPTGNRTLAEAGVCTIIKTGVAEYDIWGIGLT